jgi:hypothetical protein
MSTKTDLNRRKFLLAVGLGGAGAAAAVVGTRAALRRAGEGTGAKGEAGKGYQVTAHVRSYYRTARV